MLGEKSEKDEEPYFVEVDNNGCPHCRAGRNYTVIGPDGLGCGTSYDDEEDAMHMAEELNAAYFTGRASVGA